MFKISGNGPYCAISYDGLTFKDLEFYLSSQGKPLSRLNPDDFLASCGNTDVFYMNLVTQFPLRKEICQHLDHHQLRRFTVLPEQIYITENIKDGVFVYPGTIIYPSAKIQSDVIIHANSAIAHGVEIGQGSFISGQVTVCGSSQISKYCWIGAGTMIVDKVSVAEGTSTAAKSLIINDIIQENTYYKKHINF
jgi:UDP-3-O-[3-hydroxymyristoyl] glucosamine N-acyltransferase